MVGEGGGELGGCWAHLGSWWAMMWHATIPASLSLADKLIVVPTSLNEGRGEGDGAAYPHCHCHPSLFTMWGWAMRNEVYVAVTWRAASTKRGWCECASGGQIVDPQWL